jgi:hypothetical protein
MLGARHPCRWREIGEALIADGQQDVPVDSGKGLIDRQ